MITILLINDADLGKSISSSVFHFGNVGVAISASQIKIITRFISSSTQEGSRTTTADPDNTGRSYNDIIGDLGDHSVPEGWVQRPKFNEKGDVPGPPIQWQKPEDPDNVQPGYGYIPTDTTNTEEIFFYHSDHLGSTSYITDAKANITQFDAYLPYGELLVDEHTSTEEMPYKFNGKELDQETGLYYYGARYMNPMTSLWYGVDALTEKYPSIGGYVYCAGNPAKLQDIRGFEPTEAEAAMISKHVYGGTDASETQYNLKKSGWEVSHIFDDIDLGSNSEEGFKSQFYERTINGKTEFCYAFAGTDDWQDVKDDYHQFIGETPEQYKKAVANAEVISIALQDKYGENVDLTYVGHSLGGGLATVASMATGHKAKTFNPAAIVSSTLKGNASNVTNYIATSIPIGYSLLLGGRLSTISIGGDVVTIGQRLFWIEAPGTSIPVYTSIIAGHSIDNFYNYYYPSK